MKAEDFKALKQRVKNEMNRRDLSGSTATFGSLKEYGSSTYDFTTEPKTGEPILAEQGKKVANVLYAIADSEIPLVEKGQVIKDMDKITAYMDMVSTEDMEGSKSSCRGACSGLCAGSCIGGCNGCSGKCDTGCMGCTATCGSGCANSLMYA